MSFNMSMIKLGPAGGNNGTAWDEKGKGEIAKIFVSHNDHAYIISSLQFVFVENGNFVLSGRYGHAKPTRQFTTVAFDFPSEFLTWIGGDKGPSFRGYTVLKSITFGTNKGTYGPYGKTTPSSSHSEFNFRLGVDRCFGGFHGTVYNDCIESIGLYVKPITSSMIASTTISQVKVKGEQD